MDLDCCFVACTCLNETRASPHTSPPSAHVHFLELTLTLTPYSTSHASTQTKPSLSSTPKIPSITPRPQKKPKPRTPLHRHAVPADRKPRLPPCFKERPVSSVAPIPASDPTPFPRKRKRGEGGGGGRKPMSPSRPGQAHQQDEHRGLFFFSLASRPTVHMYRTFDARDR